MGAEKLLSCPFCGSDKPYVTDWDGRFYAHCPGCAVSTAYFNRANEAADFWNKRKQLSQ